MHTSLQIGQKTFAWGERTYLMGILNVTPDSFSGDGLLASPAGSAQEQMDAILAQARRFAAAGADILDVGGESTRPGAEPVSLEEETRRVVPVIRLLAAEIDLPISVDTYKAAVAEEALQAGAHLVNDVWGFKPTLIWLGWRLVAAFPVILMHNRSSWANAEMQERLGGRYVGIPYENLLEDIRSELLESVADRPASRHAADEHIILDPGIGFGKTVEQNLELIDRLGEIRELGYPVLLWSLAQVVHRLHPRPAARPAPGGHRRGRGHRHCPRGGYRARARCRVHEPRRPHGGCHHPPLSLSSL